MPHPSNNRHTLDPQTPEEWEEFRALAHRMVDDMVHHLSTLDQQTAWKAVPTAVRDSIHEPVPLDGVGANAVYEQFLQNVLPFPNGNLHPRYWGWVQGTGMPLAMMADMLAAAMNPHLAGFNQAPALVEEQVVAWLAELMGFPKDTSGVFASGGTMANIIGLTVARHAKAGWNVREDGLQGQQTQAQQPYLTMYCSSETHGWVQKGVELLGLGNGSLRRIPVDKEFRINIAALREAIATDRAHGHQPICVIGTAGTVNTGATDDLDALATLCAEEDLWFHVDGAFGALARLSASLAPIVKGIEKADSVGFDLHKWGYLPFECACVLVRDRAAHHATFSMNPSYLAPQTRGVIAGGLPFTERGVDLTRGFKALKAWMTFKAHGINAIAAAIEQNVEQMRYLASLIQQNDCLELLAPVPLNIVCFRYTAPNLSDETLNALNQELLLRLQESGRAVVSSTVLNGRFALRAANVNHRSQFSDFDLLVRTVLEIGTTLVAEFQ